MQPKTARLIRYYELVHIWQVHTDMGEEGCKHAKTRVLKDSWGDVLCDDCVRVIEGYKDDDTL